MQSHLHLYSVPGIRSDGEPLLTERQEHAGPTLLAISQNHLRPVLTADAHLGHDCQLYEVTLQGASCLVLKTTLIMEVTHLVPCPTEVSI